MILLTELEKIHDVRQCNVLQAQLTKLSIFILISLKRSYIIGYLSDHDQAHRKSNRFENLKIYSVFCP